MPLFTKNNLTSLFIHIPKTGGTSIEKWLGERGELTYYSPTAPAFMSVTPQHLTQTDLEGLMGTNSWDFSFTIVRNPYDRIESEYFFRTDHEAWKFGARTPFPLWLRSTFKRLEQNPVLFDNHLRRQIEFIGPGTSVFCYEDGLESILGEIQEDLGLSGEDTELPHACTPTFPGP